MVKSAGLAALGCPSGNVAKSLKTRAAQKAILNGP
jgi:hypothetical protein